MIINETTLNGKWLEFKGEIQSAWGKLTSDEIEQTKGDIKSISGLILQKYGERNEVFHDRLSAIIQKYTEKYTEKYADKKDHAVEQIKKELN